MVNDNVTEGTAILWIKCGSVEFGWVSHPTVHGDSTWLGLTTKHTNTYIPHFGVTITPSFPNPTLSTGDDDTDQDAAMRPCIT